MMRTLSIRPLALSLLLLPGMAGASTTDALVNHYAQLAHTIYADAQHTATTLSTQIDAFLQDPSDTTLHNARQAWVEARVPYMQSEAFRFGNPWVDDWEGRVNAWPLDEGLIDYVSGDVDSIDNPYASANIIAATSLSVGGQNIDTSTIDAALIGQTLHELDGIESNVASGYHAIEFLLWGQDLHGTNPGAGERPASDFSLTQCTHKNCDRRRDYLRAVTDLLLTDLNDAVVAWAPGGAAHESIVNAEGDDAIARMLTGMGSLAYGELAGERIKLGLLLNDPEEEHDCFSDNTHWAHYYDARSIENVYTGTYTRSTGEVFSGPSLSDWVAAKSPDADEQLRLRISQTNAAMDAMVEAAAAGNTFDVLIAAGNTAGNQIVQDVVDALVRESRSIERVVTDIGLGDAFQKLGSQALDGSASS